MAINYIEKGNRLHEVIEESGHWLREHNGVWISSNDVSVQAIIDSFDELAEAKKIKRQELRDQYLVRIQMLYPDIETVDIIDLAFDIFRSVIPSSRSANADFQNMIDTRQARRSIRNEINAITIVADVKAYDVVNNPLWPV